MKAEKKIYQWAFTLTEVVIMLIVIGVISAITVPMLNNNVDDKKWNVARQKAQASIGEAFKLATVNGYVTPDYGNTKDFVTKVLTKYLKINKQCDTAQACGFSSQVKRADGKSSRAIPTSWTDSTRAYVLRDGASGSGWNYTTYTSLAGRSNFNNSTFFQTLDGFSVAFFFNPYCAYDERDRYTTRSTTVGVVGSYLHVVLDTSCMNAVYDMNGKKGPNQVGKDVGFVGSFWNGFGVKSAAVLPYREKKVANNANMPGSGSDYWKRAIQYCKELHNDDWKLPNVDELSLLYLNWNLLTTATRNWFWSNIPLEGSNGAWLVNFYNGFTYGTQDVVSRNDNSFEVICVRNNALK